MTPKRPKELKWIGKTYGDGRPVEFINDVEPRDYDEAETAELSQDQLASARRSGLYREVAPPEPKKKTAKTTAKAKPAAVEQPVDHETAGDTPDTAAEPAPEGEGS